jgi:hypothetical protein
MKISILLLFRIFMSRTAQRYVECQYPRRPSLRRWRSKKPKIDRFDIYAFNEVSILCSSNFTELYGLYAHVTSCKLDKAETSSFRITRGSLQVLLCVYLLVYHITNMLKKVILRLTLTFQFYFQLMQIKDDDMVPLLWELKSVLSDHLLEIDRVWTGCMPLDSECSLLSIF